MPGILPTFTMPHVAQIPPKMGRTKVGEELVVEWRTQLYNVEKKTASYTGGIIATYGQTVLTADSLELDYTNKIGHASGAVKLVDPEGELEAHDLTFNWETKEGEARQVKVRIDRVTGTVDRLQIINDKVKNKMTWVMEGVYATPSLSKNPDIAFSAPKLVLDPGRRGRAIRPTVYLFGRKIATLPTSTFSLDKRVEGLRWPAISFQRKAGVGLSWSSGFLLDDQTAASAQVASFPDVLPSLTLAYTRSFLPATKVTRFLLPTPELDERARNGYMENIYLDRPTGEDDDLRSPRRTLAILSTWNQGTSGRLVNSSAVSKALELGYEAGGSMGGFGFVSHARLQQIREGTNQPWVRRGLLTGTLQAPPIKLGNQLTGRLRLDGYQALGKNNFGWGRGAASVIFEPDTRFRVGASYVLGSEFGTPTFLMDPLFSKKAVHFRGDLNLGNYKFSLMHKYDLNTRKWYDAEWAFSFLAGSFEPYVQSRLYPREFRIGFRIRAQEVLQRLTSRVVKRKAKTTKPDQQKRQSDSQQ